MANEEDDGSMFKILLATDIHLGFNERHPDRGIVFLYKTVHMMGMFFTF
jgi:hypothetical protein